MRPLGGSKHRQTNRDIGICEGIYKGTLAVLWDLSSPWHASLQMELPLLQRMRAEARGVSALWVATA